MLLGMTAPRLVREAQQSLELYAGLRTWYEGERVLLVIGQPTEV